MHKNVDDDQRGYRKNYGVILDIIQFENNKRTTEKIIGLHLPVQQKVIFPATVIFTQDKEKLGGIKGKHLFTYELRDIISAELVESVEGTFGCFQDKIGRDCPGNHVFLHLREVLAVDRADHRKDGLPALRTGLTRNHERVKRDRVFGSKLHHHCSAKML